MGLWGRRKELARLRGDLGRVTRLGQGQLLALRGRRQIGKSRLLTHLTESAGVPYLFTTAVKHASVAVQLDHLMRDLHASEVPLPGLDIAFAAPPTSWADFFARLPLAMAGRPTIVVLDEFPWAAERDPTLEGVLQNAWDRVLEQQPLLLVLVGSDLAMMERLTRHDRPLYGRATEMVLGALSPAEVGEAFPRERSAMELFDLYLATGGYPRLVSAAAQYGSARRFVLSQLEDDQSALCVTGLRVLDAEFREDLAARTVLEAIGSVDVGHATFTSAVRQLGGDEKSAGVAVTRALPALVDGKRIITVEVPVGAKPGSRVRRYRIADPYLRFWFRYCRPHLADIARGRADLAVAQFERDFASWRGRAMEPVVHDAVARLARSDARLRSVVGVGSWWDRSGAHEYDLAGVDRSGAVSLVGTVKWRARRAVSAAELAELALARSVVPGAANARLAAVCPAGVRREARADVVLTAEDLLHAFEDDERQPDHL